MATYTIELRRLQEWYGEDEVKSWFMQYNLEDFLTNDQIQSINNQGVWSKEKLASKIYDHYYMREIGFETPFLFKHKVLITMKEIMEYYLPIIYSYSLNYDPLINVDYTETFTRNIDNDSQNKGTSNSSSNATSDNFSILNSTPQTNITKQDLNNGFYATETTQSNSQNDINDTTSTSNDATSSTVENYERKTKGNSGVSATAQKLLDQYRDTIQAIDTKIINDLNVLFMGIY